MKDYTCSCSWDRVCDGCQAAAVRRAAPMPSAAPFQPPPMLAQGPLADAMRAFTEANASGDPKATLYAMERLLTFIVPLVREVDALRKAAPSSGADESTPCDSCRVWPDGARFLKSAPDVFRVEDTDRYRCKKCNGTGKVLPPAEQPNAVDALCVRNTWQSEALRLRAEVLALRRFAINVRGWTAEDGDVHAFIIRESIALDRASPFTSPAQPKEPTR